jgi:hypothetical protein
MCEVCRTDGEKFNWYRLMVGSRREGDHREDQDIGGWFKLGWILERWMGWTGLVCLRIGTGGKLL